MGGSDDYRDRQAAADMEYDREYKKWITSLSPDELREIATMDLDRPLFDRRTYTPGQPLFDTATGATPAEPTQQSGDAPADWQQQLAEAIEGVAILLVDAQNPRLEADILSFVCGFHARMGRSGTELSVKYGLSRATWSKRCVQLRRRLGLSPSPLMKTLKACESYKHFNGQMPTGKT